jgi:hypothetical protein
MTKQCRELLKPFLFGFMYLSNTLCSFNKQPKLVLIKADQRFHTKQITAQVTQSIRIILAGTENKNKLFFIRANSRFKFS